jgi:hypothetical protein
MQLGRSSWPVNIHFSGIAKTIDFSIHALSSLPMISPRVFVMMLALTASVVAITVLHSQVATASSLDEVPGGGNLSIPREEGNATMMTNQTVSENMTGVAL